VITDVGSAAPAPTAGLAAPAASDSPPALPGGKLGKDEFLKMLVAQLRNQDPMNPMKGDDMAAQLAQFSSLEQLTQIGKTLEGQGTQQQDMIAALNGTAAIGAFGKTVVAAGDQVLLPETGSAAVRVEVGGRGGVGMLRLFDLAGREVGVQKLGSLPPGQHDITLGSWAQSLPVGPYTYALEVVDAAGEPVASRTFTTGRVDGIRYGADGPMLTASGMTIPFGSVVQIQN
jgi:flagellar basal-body rod modification protein FlgD